ncbi:endonuclease/exonuclease/phosphatase family protein [Kitasatospora sp. GP82]|uniref:endonuclease/exonuclease/phosphatase family protein n=1 Tax=Kitasatospora sp. GP82 TaxID=3035089 RepID=UPI0024744B49|nr:endonuclease/exonuclease/phosphatase family protein [Kitasatospora sp. GP82]MDH6126076.1 exonuclease III [Kitasatospora sp. GP82]
MATGSTLVLGTPTSPTEGDKLTFRWTTDAPDPKNWVGIYDGTRRPGTGSSLLWKYTADGAGDVQLDTSALTGGPYTAYLLAKDGYGILAQTAPFSFEPKPAPVRAHLAVDALTATRVAPGAAVNVRLAGLWMHGTGAVEYRRTGGDSWLSVGSDGTVTGTAPRTAPAHPGTVTVEVKDASGAVDTVTVQVQVKAAAEPLRLKIASWNLWDAGTHSTDGVEKQLRTILTQGLDVLALQETAGTAAQALATALGWYAYQSAGSVGILSRYPLTAVTGTTASLPAAAVTVQLPGRRGVRLWAAHLDESDYGPYAVQDGRSAAQVEAAEAASTRGRQAQALAAAVKADLAAGTPVILAAGLSSPSHLDWTAANAAAHFGAGRLDWPVTVALQGAGLTDAYRKAHPDPVASPGTTWSPTRRVRGSKPEPQDRIDQIQYAGRLTLVEAHTLTVGWPQPDPATAANEWPSDTAAAVATFTL